MLKVPQEVLEKFLIDPVMAAYVILGMEFDTFQKDRFRDYWWVPNVTDNSAVGTGKTAVDFAYVTLRPILCSRLGNHVAAVYFPNFQTMKDTFWPYFQAAMERSDIFCSLLKMHNGKLGEHKDPGAWWMEFKDGSRIVAPAPGFMTDSQMNAGRDFNTLMVDDYLRAMDMGEGLEKQLIDRVRRPCFNQEHRIWCNHIKLLGHAEKPSHRGYGRLLTMKRAILDGSTTHKCITWCHLDWSDKPVAGSTFRKKYCNQRLINEQRKGLTWDQYSRQYLGIWSRDGQNYYPEIALSKCYQRINPLLEREYEHEINVLGMDFAPGVSLRADYSAASVFRMVEIVPGVKLDPNWILNGRPFHCGFTFAAMPKGLDAPRTAQFIHILHRQFGFAKIVIDPGGGGLWVYPEMKKDCLLIDGIQQTFRPLCTRYEPIISDKQPIVSFFKRGADFDEITERPFLTGDDGFIAYWHLQYRMAWEAREIAVPMPMDERNKKETDGWPSDQQWAQRILDTGMKQLNNVRQLADKDGVVMTSGRGFPIFRAVGKKDVAYSKWYAWCGARLVLQANQAQSDVDDEACFSAF